ncbi:MAG: vancomycin high temperature exclusion protein [Spirochaetes bacterium ADurb.Bin218]|jgi:SanA protein|nr:YdcF family protein [Spirochaetota bacterium]OQA99712.1 MAG: vancomycin high temperature exclusion protein [Spirochaetes bacterium ADurb.Bin218]HOQ11006.1 ElyC/SanA/YdcF family protein [Spirochaetota bacterium]HOV08154.1 ElyC/SanA/YdcF family protein [Spirochaetota bacterium]HPX90333.1 ElyC/SanA/YdcF family protein [Spirochaetota bacterium]
MFVLKRRIFSIVLTVFLTGILFMVAVDIYISACSGKYLSENLEDIPFNKCGLLLGTSKYRPEGGINPYFKNRLDAAAKLYHAGKINCIIASGDNSEKYYNEPRFMINGLKERGIPAEKIYPDFAGFRTFDSVFRAKYVFGQDSLTVISQKFHNERAVYIGQKIGLSIYGFNALDPDDSDRLYIRIREIFARAKAFIDLNLTGERPKFLGEKIIIK